MYTLLGSLLQPCDTLPQWCPREVGVEESPTKPDSGVWGLKGFCLTASLVRFLKKVIRVVLVLDLPLNSPANLQVHFPVWKMFFLPTLQGKRPTQMGEPDCGPNPALSFSWVDFCTCMEPGCN